MTTIADLVTRFADTERPTGNLLDDTTLLAQGLAAARMYAGYARLEADDGTVVPFEVDEDTDLSESEWAIVRPLFLLYVERETALHLEATRGLGLDPFGRSSGEIAGDILAAEAELPHRAFCYEVQTV